MTPQEIVSHEEIAAAAGNANFGSTPPAEVLKFALLQTACGFSTGHTVLCMMLELGLVKKHPLSTVIPHLTIKGKNYLWACFGDNKGY